MADPRFIAARRICRRHARSFYTASIFLPRRKRGAAYAVYAFCRLLDDATDLSPDPQTTAAQIDRSTTLLDDIYAGGDGPSNNDESSLAIRAFAVTVRAYDIPRQYFTDLADGCRMDLTINRYNSWDDLQTYCYRVAGVVGLIMCRVFGLSDSSAQSHAIEMGKAMQLTNILRDVKEDLDRGRIYLPAEDMARFNVTETNLAAGLVNEDFMNLMRFEIERARAMFNDAATGLSALPPDGSRGTAAAMTVIYAGILGAIERQRYDVFTRRAHLGLFAKLARLPKARRLIRHGNDGAVF